jgi:hypothetical protein
MIPRLVYSRPLVLRGAGSPNSVHLTAYKAWVLKSETFYSRLGLTLVSFLHHSAPGLSSRFDGEHVAASGIRLQVENQRIGIS